MQKLVLMLCACIALFGCTGSDNYNTDAREGGAPDSASMPQQPEPGTSTTDGNAPGSPSRITEPAAPGEEVAGKPDAAALPMTIKWPEEYETPVTITLGEGFQATMSPEIDIHYVQNDAIAEPVIVLAEVDVVINGNKETVQCRSMPVGLRQQSGLLDPKWRFSFLMTLAQKKVESATEMRVTINRARTERRTFRGHGSQTLSNTLILPIKIDK